MPLAAVLAVPLAAQSPTAGITGLVRDSASRPLAGVEVRARDPMTGLSYAAASSAAGRYWLRGLPPGTYHVTARRIGLRTAAVRGVELAIGRTLSLDLTLGRAAVALDPLAVTIDDPPVETATSDVSYVLERERIERLPEESRQLLELAQLVPGATAGTDATGGPEPFGTQGATVGALNRQSLGVLVDGADITEAILGDLGGSLPLLAVQEFEVIQSQYSADLGRAASGVVNVVTRRGGNELRAEGFGLFRHQALTARGAFEEEKPDFNRRHWGAAVGGAIAADRTHFFAAFERRVENEFSTVNTGGAFPAYEGTFRTPFIDNLMFARLDHRASDAHHLTLRYAGEVGSELGGVGEGTPPRAFENGRHSSLYMHGGLLTHRWTPGGSWLNEARLHVVDSRRGLERNAPDGPMLVYPSVRAGPHAERARLRALRVELRDDLSWTADGKLGTHRLEIGTHLSWQQNEVSQVAFENGRFHFLTDTSSTPAFGIVNLDGRGLRLDARNLQLAAYIQDHWNPVPDLTLDLGLRYDVETNGSNQGFVSPFAGDLPFIRSDAQAVDWDNVAPRFGFAWDPAGDGRMVVRGGFGVFHDALVAGPLLAFERSSGVRTAEILSPGTTDVDSLAIDPDDVAPVVWTNGDIETPRTHQLSLGVERVLPGAVILRVDGVLIHGTHLLLQRDLNPMDAGGARAFPDFASVNLLESEGRAEAKMLLIDARKAFPGGWIEVAYTLADRRNTNDTWTDDVPQSVPDHVDLDAEWGPAAWDERHRVVATGGVELPSDLSFVAKAIYSSARPFTAVRDDDDLDPNNDRLEEGRNARRGPDFFRTDLGLRWHGIRWGRARIALVANVFNLFDTVNGVPSSVENRIGEPDFGEPSAAFPGRQVELGLRVAWE